MSTKFNQIIFVAALSLMVSQVSAKNYQTLSACEKQTFLWKKVVESENHELPDFNNLGLMQFLAMTFQELKTKTNLDSDIAPKGWKKYLHRRGVMAKVKIVAMEGSPFTGVFEGADCALLRLSLTYNPKGSKGVAPGLALKVLRDSTSSANVSALYSLEGQGKDYNFLKHSLSNIVPIGNSIGTKLIHRLFKRVTDYPEELKLADMAKIDSKGKSEKSIKHPTQIFFVPNKELSFASTEHDIRRDLISVTPGTTLYTIHALKNTKPGFDYSSYQESDIPKLIAQSEPIAQIVTTSKFLSSEFGDEGIFFRHEVRD